jgi:phosphatidylinositol alpha-1,6-mannosyltransferase
LAPEQVRVLPNTVDSRFTPGTKPLHLLERYGLIGKRVLLTVSRLSAAERYKGHDRVIQLLPELLTTHPDTVYAIAGDGDGRPALERLAEHVGVADACRFIGEVDEADLVEHYRMADVFIMPSTGEGFGIVYLEAMACGIPAIGLDCDGSADPLEACALGRAVSLEGLSAQIAVRLAERRGEVASPASVTPIEFAIPVFGERVELLFSVPGQPAMSTDASR